MTDATKVAPTEDTWARSDEPREWVVSLHARSAMRLRGDTIVDIESAPDTTVPVDQIRLRNAYFTHNDKLVFKGLIAQARGHARSGEEALALLAERAAPYLQIASLAANASVDEADHVLIYATPTADLAGCFFEQRACGVVAPAATVRSVELDDFGALLNRLVGHDDEHRLQRAIAHYRQALRSLEPFNRMMSAEHLWMACENLGQVIYRRVCAESGLPANGDSKHALAVAAGFAPEGDSRKHLYAYDSHLRVVHIFGGDKRLHDMLREASDALEHGYGGFDKIQQAAHGSADAAFAKVRRAILTEIGLPAEAALFAEKYDHALGGWQPRLELFGRYTSPDQEGWPYFYGASTFGEMTGIEDLDDDQARNVTLTTNASGASLLDGQTIDLDDSFWDVPLAPGHQATTGEIEISETSHEGE